MERLDGKGSGLGEKSQELDLEEESWDFGGFFICVFVGCFGGGVPVFQDNQWSLPQKIEVHSGPIVIGIELLLNGQGRWYCIAARWYCIAAEWARSCGRCY